MGELGGLTIVDLLKDWYCSSQALNQGQLCLVIRRWRNALETKMGLSVDSS